MYTKPVTVGLGAILLVILFFVGHALADDIWWEHAGEDYGYDLSRFRILILLGDDFDYRETMIVKEYWENRQARVDIAGTGDSLNGYILQRTTHGWDRSATKTVVPDVPISWINVLRYHAIFVPGGTSPESLIGSDSGRVTGILQDAHTRGIILAAIGRGPRLLAAADLLQRRRVTGHEDIFPALKDAGARYVTEVCVTDENIITGNWPFFETFAVKVAERLLFPDDPGPSEQSIFSTNLVWQTIKDRRSIEKFRNKDLKAGLVRKLLEAATWAPSADNNQPWKFIVVREEATKEKIRQALIARLEAHYTNRGIPIERMMARWANIFAAPVHIFAFSDPRTVKWDEGYEEIQHQWNSQGVALACYNILLAADALDIGSLWFGLSLTIEDEIKAMLNVPAEVRLVTTIALGYAAKDPLPRVRKPVVEVAFDERWPLERE